MAQIYLLAFVLALSSGLAIVTRRFNLPIVVSYIASGAILSLFGIVSPEKLGFLKFLPEIGLAFLLFLVGMEFDLKEFRSIGRNVIFASLGQVIISAVFLLFLVNKILVLSFPANLVLALALTFSSTILAVKILSGGGEITSLHGKMSVGILLLEDLLAIVLLMFLGSFNPAIILPKAVFLIWLALFSGRRLLPQVFRYTADNLELMFLTAIGWCLVFVSLAQFLGVSVGIGAFLAGISLAQSDYKLEIGGRIKPLRDFFIMIFFIDLGLVINVLAIRSFLFPALLFSLYALIIKPAIFFLLFVGNRFRAHTAFRTAVLLSSLSEFSLIVVYSAAQLGIIPDGLVSLVVLSTVFSFIFSSLLISHSAGLYKLLKNILKKLERQKTLNLDFMPKEETEFTGHAVLVGCHRSGQIVLKVLKKLFGENLLVADFNPEVIETLKNSFVTCLYGDVADPEILERLRLKEAKLVISTVRDLADNLVLLDALEKTQSKAVIIITASDTKEAASLYERGAHHVSLPLTLEGNSIGRLIYDYQDNLTSLTKERERKLGEIKRTVLSS